MASRCFFLGGGGHFLINKLPYVCLCLYFPEMWSKIFKTVSEKLWENELKFFSRRRADRFNFGDLDSKDLPVGFRVSLESVCFEKFLRAKRLGQQCCDHTICSFFRTQEAVLLLQRARGRGAHELYRERAHGREAGQEGVLEVPLNSILTRFHFEPPISVHVPHHVLPK